MHTTEETYPGLGLVVQNLLDLLEDFGCQLRDDLQRLQVVKDLFGLGCAEDNGARIRAGRNPRQRKLIDAAPEL